MKALLKKKEEKKAQLENSIKTKMESISFPTDLLQANNLTSVQREHLFKACKVSQSAIDTFTKNNVLTELLEATIEDLLIDIPENAVDTLVALSKD